MERRKHPRIRVHWLISFFEGRSSLKKGRISGAGTVRNLSMEGCKVEQALCDSGTRVYPGVQIELRLYLSDHVVPVEVDRAEVRWVKGQMFGLEFVRIAPEEQARLRHFLSTLAHAGCSTGTEMILVVEDDPTVRAYVREVLTVSGYQVLEAAHSGEALRLCSSHTGAIHLLLTDVVLPGINGWRLAELVAAVRPETQVLFMSGYPKHATIRLGSQDERATLLQKPLAPDQLTRAVHEVLDTPRGGTA